MKLSKDISYYSDRIAEIIKDTKDLDTLTVGTVRRKLENEYSVKFTEEKKKVNDLIESIYNELYEKIKQENNDKYTVSIKQIMSESDDPENITKKFIISKLEKEYSKKFENEARTELKQLIQDIFEEMYTSSENEPSYLESITEESPENSESPTFSLYSDNESKYGKYDEMKNIQEEYALSKYMYKNEK
jgi:hypothetical protein